MAHKRTNPNGTTTTSSVPFVADRWWDNPILHPLFSWSSWIAWVLEDHGYPRMRRWHKRKFTR